MDVHRTCPPAAEVVSIGTELLLGQILDTNSRFLTRELAAIGLILVMLGAIQKKIFVWHTSFWGKQEQGWYYELMFVVMNLVILTTNGGAYVLLKGPVW